MRSGSKPLPYYPLYVNDFDESPRVIAMSLAEVGLYTLALNESWKRGSIPDDPKSLATVIRKDPKEVRKAWPVVRSCFVENGAPGRLVNARQEKERTRAEGLVSTERVKRFRERSRNGNETVPETAFETVLEHVRNANASVSESSSFSGSCSEKTNGAILAKYQEFLRAWPEDRRGVDLGAQLWVSLVHSGEITDANVAEVFEGLETWKVSELWTKENGKYIPAIAKPDGTGWLQKRAWKDTPKLATRDSW